MTEGRVRFTEAQFQAYIGTLHDPAFWAPVPLKWEGKLVRNGLDAGLQRWHDLPGPMRAREAPKHWLDRPRIYELWKQPSVTRGRIFCLAVVRQPAAKSQDEPMPSAAEYQAKSCLEATGRDSLVAYVVGVIDFDQRTLQMKIRNSHVIEN